MSAILLGGASCTSVSLTIPMRGSWVADVALASPDGPADGEEATLTATAGLALNGKVRRAAGFAGARRARLVGGLGWRKVLPPRSYDHPTGSVRLSEVAVDAAREAGEKVNVPADRALGKRWVRDRGRAERVLRLAGGGEWYVDEEGVAQLKARESSPIGSPFTVVSRDAARGRFEVAPEVPADWLPGRTFKAPTVPDEQTISTVMITAGNEGKLRVVVLAAGDERERLLADVRSMVRAEMAEVAYHALWEYEVASATDATIDATPTDPRMPAIRGCPILLPGRLPVPSGARALVGFVNADPARPVCLHVWGSQLEHLATVEGVVLLLHNLFAVYGNVIAGPWIGAAMQTALVPALNAAIAAGSAPAPPGRVAQTLAAPALAGAMAPGVPGITVAPYAAALAALKLKIANESGFFPGLGAPAQTDGP